MNCSFTTIFIRRYLSFFHAIPVKIFNVSEYRRSMCGSVHDAMWFDHANVEAEAIRSKYVAAVFHTCLQGYFIIVILLFLYRCNQQMVADAVEFLRENNGVAILDTANATVAKRAKLVAQVVPSDRLTAICCIFCIYLLECVAPCVFKKFALRCVSPFLFSSGHPVRRSCSLKCRTATSSSCPNCINRSPRRLRTTRAWTASRRSVNAHFTSNWNVLGM